MDLETRVNLFIATFQSKVRNDDFSYQTNAKTSNYLRNIGWTHRMLKEHVDKNICCDNYYRGPSARHDGSGDMVMEFGIELEGVLLYAKIAISDLNGIYLSLHPCERAIVFPLRKEGGNNE